MRRAYFEFATTGHLPFSRLISTTEPPCAVISMSTISLRHVGEALVAAAPADAAEHELLVGVFVVDGEEAVVENCAAAGMK